MSCYGVGLSKEKGLRSFWGQEMNLGVWQVVPCPASELYYHKRILALLLFEVLKWISRGV